jgi:hypothetical protein
LNAGVDVIIAVHDPERPIERAVGSVLTSRSVRRVLIVCHELEPRSLQYRLGTLVDDERVRLLEFRDGGRGPGGPFNHGLSQSDAEYVAVMGSDDSVSDGALDAWLATAAAERADMVIAPIRHAGGPRIPTPPTLRRRRLRGARDRLAFRAAPLGLIRRARFGDLRFTEGLATGEDLAYSTHIWFSDAVIVAAAAPAYYVVHDDAVRVSFSRRPLRDDLRAAQMLIDDTSIRALSARDRRALAIKLWRVNLFGAVHYRAGEWQREDREAAAELAGAIQEFSPASITVLSIAEDRLRRALLDPAIGDERIDELSERRRRFLSIGALMSSQPAWLFARDAPIRFSAASWMAGRIGKPAQ